MLTNNYFIILIFTLLFITNIYTQDWSVDDSMNGIEILNTTYENINDINEQGHIYAYHHSGVLKCLEEICFATLQ